VVGASEMATGVSRVCDVMAVSLPSLAHHAPGVFVRQEVIGSWR
jgi:hypothetical protein